MFIKYEIFKSEYKFNLQFKLQLKLLSNWNIE